MSKTSVKADAVVFAATMEDTVVEETDVMSSAISDSHSVLLGPHKSNIKSVIETPLTDSIDTSRSFDMSVFNKAHDESDLLADLCNCDSVHSNWCFIHDKVNEKQVYSITKSNDFGFLCNEYPPLPLFRPGRELMCENLLQWAHTIVSTTKCPNYQSARIKIPTELNIDNWRALCGNFEHQILLDYLEYGFPLCVDRKDFSHNSSVKNHPSALQYSADVDAYFEKEVKHKAIVGPSVGFPFPVHSSPLLSRPKSNDTSRIIVNLSSPYGDSVNDRIGHDVYDGSAFTLKYPSVDTIVDAIHDLGPDVLLSKIDVSRAFRNLRVDPSDFDLLGLSWKGMSYLDLSVPMGMKTGSALCQRTTDVLRHVMASRGVRTFNYIDDVICIHRHQTADTEFKTLYSLFEFLGVPINPNKVVHPSRSLTCMGIIVDLDAKQLSISQGKMLEILDLCRLYMGKKSITKKQFQSLLGKLLFIHRCVVPARIFVNRLLNNLRKCQGRILVNTEMKQDISWFVQFLEKFNGVVMFQNVRHTFDVYVDASLTGMGGCWNNNAYAVSRHLSATWNLSITQLEMLNVLIALRTFGHMWADESVVIHIKNNAAMFALKNGKIKDTFMQSVARSIWLVAAVKDIKMDFVHIAGNDNTNADILSRVFESEWNQKRMNLFSNYVWWPVNGVSFYPNVFV